MAVRVTHAEVIAIINTDLTDTTPFITAANSVVNNVLATEISAGDIDSDTLKEIERWLAAHFITARDPLAAREQTEDAAVTYQGKWGDDLKSTSYGQKVLLLDHTGRFASAGAKKAQFKVLG